MLILSQNKEALVNYGRGCSIGITVTSYLKKRENDNTTMDEIKLYNVTFFGSKDSIFLGEYKNKEFAKDVIAAIAQKTAGEHKGPFVMPQKDAVSVEDSSQDYI